MVWGDVPLTMDALPVESCRSLSELLEQLFELAENGLISDAADTSMVPS